MSLFNGNRQRRIMLRRQTNVSGKEHIYSANHKVSMISRKPALIRAIIYFVQGENLSRSKDKQNRRICVYDLIAAACHGPCVCKGVLNSRSEMCNSRKPCDQNTFMAGYLWFGTTKFLLEITLAYTLNGKEMHPSCRVSKCTNHLRTS